MRRVIVPAMLAIAMLAGNAQAGGLLGKLCGSSPSSGCEAVGFAMAAEQWLLLLVVVKLLAVLAVAEQWLLAADAKSRLVHHRTAVAGGCGLFKGGLLKKLVRKEK